MKCYGVTQSFIWFGVGGVVMVIGGVLFVVMPSIVDAIIALLLPLSPSSLIYPIWQEIPVPIYREFYVFHYKNGREYSNDPTIQLEVEERGPYVYREVREKVFIKWDSDGEFVNYRETHTYPFISELSNGSEFDVVTVPNVALLTVKSLRLDIVAGLPYNNLFIEVAVTPFIWSGYYVEKLDGILPGGMFALFYGKNGTDDMEYRINRGTRDVGQQFEIETWNGLDTLTYWTDECAMINGSDGTMYNGDINKGDRVYIFVSDICRSIYVDYVEEMSYRGFSGHRFRSDGRLFADPGTNPENKCFCGDSGTECYATGFANLTACKGAPIYLSHPHMLFVDEYIQNQTIGQHPDETLHVSEVNIEPNSGMMLYIHIKFQINVKMPALKIGIKDFKEQMLPVMWLDETATLDDPRIDLLNHDLFMPMNIAYALPIVVMCLGAAASAIGLGCMISLLWTQKRKDDEKKKLAGDSDSIF